MLNVITIQGRLTRDPELRHTTNGLRLRPSRWPSTGIIPARTAANGKRTLSTSLPGAARRSLSASILPRDSWQSSPDGCRSGHGRTTTGISAEAPRSSRSTCILAAARKKPAARLRRRRPRMARPRRWKNCRNATMTACRFEKVR